MSASVGQLKKIGPQDVPGAPSWMRPVFAFLNSIVELVNRAFAGGITFQENIRCAIVELQVQTGATYGTAGEFTTVKFLSGLSAKPIACEVVYVQDRDLPDAVLAGPHACTGAWRESSGEISVKWISGLENSRRYIVRFRVS